MPIIRLWCQEDRTTTMKNPRHIEPSLGDLIAAAGEVAFEYSNSDVEAYNLARAALVEIIKKTSHSLDLDKEFEDLSSPSALVH